GALPDLAEYAPLEEANRRLERMRQSNAPASLMASSRAALRQRVRAYADALLSPAVHVTSIFAFQPVGHPGSALFAPAARVLFSARAVISPGPDLTLDEVGLPDEMAWALFGPLVSREGLADAEAVAARSAAATQALDACMAKAWVLVNR